MSSIPNSCEGLDTGDDADAGVTVLRTVVFSAAVGVVTPTMKRL